jgi:hypothetical protein
MLRKFIGSCALALLIASPEVAVAGDRQEKSAKSKGKHTERSADRHREADLWPRETGPGHQPHDQNGDGVVSRNEWPGNDDSFRELDRNKDGVLSEADRRLRPKDGRVYRRR